MAKYKVGDRVRIVSERPASPCFVDSMVQYLGKTLTVSKVEEETLGAIYRFKEATYPADFTPIAKAFYPNTNGMWAFCEDWISGLAEPEKPADDGLSVVIRFHGRMTVAELYKNGKVVKVENARCNPKDEYSRSEGARIAVERLFEKKGKESEPKVSKPKVGDKFKIVGNTYFHGFHIGEIVTLVSVDSNASRYEDRNGMKQWVYDCDVMPYRGKTESNA